MAKERDLTVQQTVEVMQHLHIQMEYLEQSLILRVQLQEITEIQYNELVQLAREGIAFLQSCQENTIATTEWIARRDDLITRAQALIADANKA
jgi:hypothetical protein